MTRPLVVLRPDAGPGAGAGHVTRCSALAHALRGCGARTLLLLPEGALAPRFAGPLRRLPVGGRREGVRAGDAPDLAPDAWVVDSYLLDARARAAFAARAPVWVPLDAPRRRVTAHGAFSPLPMPASTAIDVPPRRRCFGPRYAPLRPDLPRRTNDRASRDVLISFGASDPEGATEATAGALRQAGWRVRAVLGPLVARRDALAARLEALGPGVAVLDGAGGLVRPLAACPFAVLSASQSLLEALALGRLVVAVETARNQGATRRWASAAGVARSAGRWSATAPGRIVRALEALAASPEDGRRRRARARATIDGRGAQRLARALLTALGGERA